MLTQTKDQYQRARRWAQHTFDRTGIPYAVFYVWHMLYVEPSMSGGVASTSGLTPRLLNAGAAILLVAPAFFNRTLRRFVEG
jgi:hypothetical protein